MSKASQEYAREKGMRSFDVIKVHNPTDEDYIFWDDKFGPKAQRLMVPKQYKNLKDGAGNSNLPRYLAERFVKGMITNIINTIANKQTEKKKVEIRQLSRADQLNILEKEIVRTNDPKLWEEWFPKVWLGVVSKYGGQSIPEPTDPTIPDSGNPMTDAMNKLSMADKPYEEPDSKK